ncbi:hypothetical protein MRX96_022732 [Rhipicephalus microplus]
MARAAFYSVFCIPSQRKLDGRFFVREAGPIFPGERDASPFIVVSSGQMDASSLTGMRYASCAAFSFPLATLPLSPPRFADCPGWLTTFFVCAVTNVLQHVEYVRMSVVIGAADGQRFLQAM